MGNQLKKSSGHKRKQKQPSFRFRSKSIFKAIDENNPQELQRLIKNGYNVNRTDISGLSPLHLASLNGNYQCVKILLEAGCEIKSCRLFLSPLHFGCQNSNTDIVNILLDFGDGINSMDALGNTPLSLAIEFNKLSNVKLLLARGAHLKIQNCLLAIENGCIPVFRYLLTFDPSLAKKIDLSKYRFTAKSHPTLKLLYYCDYKFNVKNLRINNRPMDLYDFILGNQIVMPPPHYNRNKDMDKFEEFIQWLEDQLSQPFRLSELARIAFFAYCGTNSVSNTLARFPKLPKKMVSYLMLEN